MKLLHIIQSTRRLCSLLLSGNKQDRIETFTQCAAWYQFAVDHFLGNVTYGLKITALRNEITLKTPPGE